MMKRLAIIALLLWSMPAFAQTSPDGSILLPGTTGNLVTSHGTWTLGAQVRANGARTDYQILLNGASVSGYGDELAVAGGGKLYARNTFDRWYQYIGSTTEVWRQLLAPPVMPGTVSPKILGFTAEPTSVTVTWMADENTDSCKGTNFDSGGYKNGMMSFTPLGTVTQFILTCTGPGGSTSATVEVPK